jgi:ankyrin repeat protein
VRLLLDHGARSDLKDSLGRTPYDRAKLMNQTEVLVILKK